MASLLKINNKSLRIDCPSVCGVRAYETQLKSIFLLITKIHLVFLSLSMFEYAGLYIQDHALGSWHEFTPQYFNYFISEFENIQLC